MRKTTLLVLMMSAAIMSSMSAAASSGSLGDPPAGFTSEKANVLGTSLHYVRGGSGPAVILVHGFPENWVEYRAIMPRLAKRFTVIAVDLPGIGASAPAHGGYDSANLAAHIHALSEALKLERPYVVGHDLGAIVTYAFVRRFPEYPRGVMILDVPMPGLAGWDESVKDAWHIGFIQADNLAEKLVSGRQDAFLSFILSIAKFTPEERAYYVKTYGDPQLHAAFEIYRGFPADAKWNAAQSGPNDVPLTVAVGAQSFFASLLPTYVEGYRAKGMTHIESAHIPGSSHYVLADNPEAVAALIEQHGSESRAPR